MVHRTDVPNAFEFVTLAGARARQLLRGCTPRTHRQRQAGPARAAGGQGRQDRQAGGRAGRPVVSGHQDGPDRARRHRRHRRLQGGRGRARAAEARPRGRGDHDAVGAAFVGEVTFEAITRRRVITDQYARGANADIEHIALASSIGLLLVAPATANVIGKFANGIADDFLTSLYLATRAPVLMAPAMNTNMLEHAAVQRNMATLAARGVRFVDPGEGYLACGWIGKGRLAEPEAIVEAAQRVLAAARIAARPARPGHRRADLRGHRPRALRRQPVERQDGLRHRRRSGAARRARRARLGAVARAGPRRRRDRQGAARAEMHAAVLPHAGSADIVVMAAAVADYTPEGGGAAAKIEKSDAPLRLDAGAHAGHPRRARCGARTDRGRPCSSASPRRPATRSRAAAPS